MRTIRRFLSKLRNDERGSITPMFVVFVPALVLVIGLVVDGAGKIQANEHAQSIASGASRAAANAVASEVIVNGGLSLDNHRAQIAARDYIEAAGMTGTVTVTGNEIVGCRIVRSLGVVRGITVRSRSVIGNLGAALQTLVSRVRQVAADGIVVSSPAGYALDVEPTRTDAGIARAALTASGADALDTLDSALALWRGEPGADLGDAPVRTAVE